MNADDLDISPELREKVKACNTPEEMLALAKAEGRKLSEEELAAVSGGASWGSCSDHEGLCRGMDYDCWLKE